MEKQVQYAGAEINYSEQGAGEVVVLLHGYLESKDIWGSFAVELSRGYRVFLIDLPGHGRSAYIEGQTIEQMSQAVNAVMTNEGVESYHLVGHSMGGYVSLACLEVFPDRLKSICLFHSHPFADAPAATAKRNREIDLVKAGKKNLLAEANIPNAFANDNVARLEPEIAKAKEIAIATDADGIIACLESMRDRKDRSEEWKASPVPALLVYGAKDNYIPAEVVTRISMPENAQKVELPESGHQGFIEEKELSIQVLTDFFRRVDAQG